MANNSTPSTRAVWRCEKILLAPQGGKQPRRSRTSKPFLASREWRRPVTLLVEYRGNAEPVIQVRARGRTWRFSGHDAFLDVMMTVWEGDRPYGEDQG